MEKHTILQDFDLLYEPLLIMLEAIGVTEVGWDAVAEAYSLYKVITSSPFIAAFQTVLHFLGYFKGLSIKLQG